MFSTDVSVAYRYQCWSPSTLNREKVVCHRLHEPVSWVNTSLETLHQKSTDWFCYCRLNLVWNWDTVLFFKDESTDLTFWISVSTLHCCSYCNCSFPLHCASLLLLLSTVHSDALSLFVNSHNCFCKPAFSALIDALVKQCFHTGLLLGWCAMLKVNRCFVFLTASFQNATRPCWIKVIATERITTSKIQILSHVF